MKRMTVQFVSQFRGLEQVAQVRAYTHTPRQKTNSNTICRVNSLPFAVLILAVLDIGGGTGLLSMMAIRAGAAHAFCCEMNPAMCAIAQECIQTNGFADSVTVLCMHSSKLTPAMLLRHLPQSHQQRQGTEDELGKVDLVVTELMDIGLLGEHM